MTRRSAGGVRFTSRRRQAVRAAERGGEDGVNLALDDLLRRSVSRAPIDESDLRKSGNVEAATKRGRTLEGRVGFAAPYAVRQHEDTTLRHTDGEAKFLEKPANENRGRYERFIAERVRKEVERAG